MHFAKARDRRAKGTLDITTDEPQLFVIFVSNGSVTETASDWKLKI